MIVWIAKETGVGQHQCRINPPIIALEENRGGFRPKRHRESAGQIQRLQEALGLASELGIHLPDDSQDSIRSLAKMLGDHPDGTDDEWFHWFASLDSDELDELARRAMKFLTSSVEPVRGLGSEILKDIVCFRDDRPLRQDIHRELVRLECYWPSCLYRDAAESITELLLQRIANDILRLEVRSTTPAGECRAANGRSSTEKHGPAGSARRRISQLESRRLMT